MPILNSIKYYFKKIPSCYSTILLIRWCGSTIVNLFTIRVLDNAYFYGFDAKIYNFGILQPPMPML